MRFFKIFVLLSFFTACAGRQNKYTWPEEKEKHQLSEVVVKMRECGFSQVVIFITTDWCPPCRKVKEYWKARTSPVPFYVVDSFSLTVQERYVLVLMDVPNKVPVCIIINGDKHDIGVGYNMCAEGLEVKLRKLKR